MNKRILNIYKRYGLDTSEIEQMLKDQEAQKRKEKEKLHIKKQKIKEIEKIEKTTGLDLTDVKNKISGRE